MTFLWNFFFLFCQITILLSLYCIADSKTVDKKNLKKGKPTKPMKPTKPIVDYFSNLTPEDKAFIKELDKQFNKHGSKIKIKVERENGTVTGKNSKRGVDGELGWVNKQSQ